MVPPTPTPSTRLLEAAAAERDELARHRDRLLAARDRLRADLAAVERSLQDVDERSHLLDRLTAANATDVCGDTGPLVPDAAPPREGGADDMPPWDGGGDGDTRADREARVGTARAAGGTRDHEPSSRTADDHRPRAVRSTDASSAGRPETTTPVVQAHRIRAGDRREHLLRGPAIRRAAVEVLLARADRPEALHYRDWFELVRAAGFEVAGKDPLAVFLTQLSRSPVIRRGTQAGVYELDVAAPARLGITLDRLHEELRRLTARREPAADLAAIRARREQLTLDINQTEKALEEAEAALAAGGALAALAATG